MYGLLRDSLMYMRKLYPRLHVVLDRGPDFLAGCPDTFRVYGKRTRRRERRTTWESIMLSLIGTPNVLNDWRDRDCKGP
jgi:hypothetical protein